jgi:hypothetical protein
MHDQKLRDSMNPPSIFRPALLGALLILLSNPVPAVDFHIAPAGNDANPGTQEQPFASLASRAIVGRPEDIAPVLALPTNELRDVTAVVYHSWEVSRHRVAGVDKAQSALITAGAAPWNFNYWGANCRYHLENFRAALDEPGEWFLDRNSMLFYLPRPGEDMTMTEVIAPLAERFLRFSGDPEKGQFLEHLVFRGLSFQHAQYVLPPQGHGDGQEAGSLVADPLFLDPDKGNFQLKTGTPATRIGFKLFDWTQAGVYGSKSWKQFAAARKYPTVEFAPEPPPPPPMVFTNDFESAPLGHGVSEANAKLSAAGQPLFDLPTSQWVYLEIVAGLGRQSTGRWELTVKLPGQTPKRLPDLPSHPAWKRLDWLGFVSNGTGSGVFYLDNLSLGNTPP